jgi:Fic family protein
MGSTSRFNPTYTITPAMVTYLMRIEAVKQAVPMLPINVRVLSSLRETARLYTTHYSTMIEGNRLTQEEVAQVVNWDQHFPGRERDQGEVQGYYAALDEVERMVRSHERITEATVKRLHALVMGNGKAKVKSTPYRDGQNVIRDSASGGIVYMPPEAHDVPELMGELVSWINTKDDLPVPIKAGIAHYQFATIHPYYDGNGRTARLLTTLILHLGTYDLKGLYALEEYYARNLKRYYESLTVGPSHNYYLGRATGDITRWVGYFIEGMADSFDKVRDQAMREAEKGGRDNSRLLRNLDAKQRKALALFETSREITAKDIAALFECQPRTSALLCQRWVETGFLEAANASKKARRYRLTDQYEAVIMNDTA